MFSTLRLTLIAITFAAVSSEERLLTTSKIRFSTREKISRADVQNLRTLSDGLPPDVLSVQLYQTADMTDLLPKAVSNLLDLGELSLMNCGINVLSPGAFHNVPKLSVLKLQDNNITAISAGVFNNLNVRKLYLHRNFIDSIAVDAFDNMPRLEMIKLNNNYLQTWDAGWFKNCPGLKQVYLRRNEIKSLPEDAFKNFKVTRRTSGGDGKKTEKGLRIYLSKNFISDIHQTAFNQLSNIEELWLDRNKLKNLNKHLFEDLENITMLSLAKNKLRGLHENQFPKLKSMKILDMTKNEVTCLPYDAIKNVKHIYLNKNRLDCECVKKLRIRLNDGEKERLLYHKC